MSNESEKITNIYVIKDENGKFWRESARLDENQCTGDFVSQWNPRAQLSYHEKWNVWNAYVRSGWEVVSLELPSKSSFSENEIRGLLRELYDIRARNTKTKPIDECIQAIKDYFDLQTD